MLNHLKWLSGLALVSLFTVGDLAGPFTQIARAQTHPTPLSNQKTAPDSIARRNYSGRIKVVYGKTTDPLSRSLIQAYQRYGFFEKIGNLMTDEIKLPRDITVVLTNCGTANAFYNEEEHAIIICNELTTKNYNLFLANGYSKEDALKTALFASIFTFYHESGHMLIHELNLPMPGKEEDIADQFSAFFLLINDSSEGKSVSSEILMSAAKLFELDTSIPNDRDFQDEHALGRQRFYSLVCMVYGASPAKYSNLVAKLDYSQSRLDRCQVESQSIVTAWQRLLKPYLQSS
jgi:Putative metallopeptidase